MEISKLYGIFLSSTGVATDSRKIKGGELFFALSGENFDGNQFALKALEDGCCRAVVSRSLDSDDPRLIKVDDTLQTLKELARYHRLNGLGGAPVLAITGTNGKTTTKELVREALQAGFPGKVAATAGNLNNEIGVPLTLLSFPSDIKVGIVEMGASHPEDLRPLLETACPDFGIITNVGKAHLQGFGSFEGVKHAKGLLYDWIRDHGGVCFANGDDPVLEGMLRERGISNPVLYGANLEGIEILPVTSDEPFLRIKTCQDIIKTNLVGSYNVPNVLAALCIARRFGVSREDAISAIEAYTPSNSRSQLIRTARNTVIADAYNANPSSMRLAVANLAAIQGPKAALLGDMRELGPTSVDEHKSIVRLVIDSGIQECCLVGANFIEASAGTGIPAFRTSADLAEWLESHPLEGYTVLVKGSRGETMEKVLPKL